MNSEELLPSLGPNVGPWPPAICWTPERQKLKDWLAEEAPSLAELYEGAVRILFELRPPGYTRFVGHAVREIRNRLPSEISGSQPAKHLSYKNRLDKIFEHWKKAGLKTDGAFPVVAMAPDSVQKLPAQVSLPHDLAVLIAELVSDHGATREKPRDAAEKLFMDANQEITKSRDAIRPAVTLWLDVTDWFMRITHDSGRKDSVVDNDELHRNFKLFETALLGIAQPFFVTTDDLDEILEEANS